MKKIFFVMGMFAMVCLLSVPAFATSYTASYTWTGGGADNNMLTSGNWNSGIPSDWADILTFATGGTRANSNNGAERSAQVIFDTDTNFTIGSSGGVLGIGNITPSSDGITADPADANYSPTYTISAPVVLYDSQTWTVSNNGTGKTTLAVSGAIGQNGGVFNLTKAGTGTLTLSGANTYSGGTTISAGILNIQNDSALGSGSVSVASGATLQLQGGIAPSVGLPLVFWAHDFLTGKSWVELTAFRSKPEWVICNSRYTLKSVQEQYPGVRTEVIYCPVRKPPLLDPRAVRKRVRENLKISESAVVLFQASRMEKSKGHSLVLEALSELKDSPEWVALFAGGAQRGHEKTYFDQMVRYSHQLGLGERVQFLGQRSDVSELLLASDVFIQPNLMPETFGISFIEAMYAGLPTVGVAGGGVDEIVTEEAGILISKPQSELLVPVLKELIGSSEKRAVLGQNGKIRADQLSNPIQQLLKTRDFLKVCLS